MTKKGIDKAFNNMKESCETVVSLRKKGLCGYDDYKKASNQIDNYRQVYMNMLTGLLLFEVISEDIYDYSFALLEDLDFDLF